MLPPPLIPVADALGAALGTVESVADYDRLLRVAKEKLAAELETAFAGDNMRQARDAVLEEFVARAVTAARTIIAQRRAAATATLISLPVEGRA